MLFRPGRDDYRVIGWYTSRVLFWVGIVMLVPAAVAVAVREHNDAFGFLIGASLLVIGASLGKLLLVPRVPITSRHALAAVALSWIVAPVFGAVPLLLSGHYGSFLDAYFDAVSGFTTTGLTLATDVDHMAYSVNLWRHLMQMLGGLATVVVVLVIFTTSAGHTGLLTRAAGHQERIIPGVLSTARFIARVAVTYAVFGTTLLWMSLVGSGLGPGQAAHHAVLLFMSAFNTGGFAPQSASIAFYRFWPVDVVVAILMIAGAFSFALHYHLWQGRRRELSRNLETRTLALSVLALFTVQVIGLFRSGAISGAGEALRLGFFQMISAHTTSGLATVPGQLVATDWGVVAPAMLVTAMALGGMVGSTAGGIKSLRVGLVAKGLQYDLRKILLPDSAVVVETYHSSVRRVLRAPQVQGAATVLLLYLVLYLVTGMVGLFYGYDLSLALFDGTAAGSATGLTVGVVRPALEWPLKAVYAVTMLVGRLEFVAVFALASFALSLLRGRV